MRKSMKAFFEKNKRGNKGFTIVELLTAMGILGILSATVLYMMTTSSKTYNKLSLEAQLQSEAQLVANAISEIAIDAYNAADVYNDAIDAAYDNTATKILVLETVEGGNKKQYVVALDSSKSELSLAERGHDGTNWDASLTHHLLGNNVSDFKVDTSRVATENILGFELVYTKSGKSYKGNYQVLMRNKMYADKTNSVTPTTPSGRLAISITPKIVYMDIVGGDAKRYYVDTISSANVNPANALDSNYSGTITTIPFKASVTSTVPGAGNTVTWKLLGHDSAMFNEPSTADAATFDLTWNVAKDFKDSPTDYFQIEISKSANQADGTTVEAEEKYAHVFLRRVHSITVNPLTGVTAWREDFEEAGGMPTSGAMGYAYVGSNGKYVDMSLNAAILSSNIEHGGGLTWKLEKKNTSGNWEACSDTYAKLQTTTTMTSTSNTIIFGSGAKHGDLYRVVATSVFDPSVSGEYVFGVAPNSAGNGNGFNSRGYCVDLNSYINSIPGLEDFNIAEITLFDVANMFDDEDSVVVAKGADGRYYLYFDYNAFKYSGQDKHNMYHVVGEIMLTVKGVGWDKPVPNPTDEDRKKYDPFGNTSPIHYPILPVYVTAVSPANNVIVIPKGKSVNVKVQTSYYNVIEQKYFGIYIDDMDTNLNRAGMGDYNAYLSANVTSGYGDRYNYVDVMTSSLTAKASQKDYPTLPMTVRFTADDYYISSNHAGLSEVAGVNWHGNPHTGPYPTSSYCDYTVYVANVSDASVFIPTPETSSGTCVWPGNVSTAEVSVSGYNAEGKLVADIAKVYVSNNKYKCKYNGHTYTYNKTYHYWYR